MDPRQPDNPLYTLGLALLELIDHPVLLTLQHPDHNNHLHLQGTLIKAFDPPTPTAPPSVTLMLGAHSTTIRLASLQTAQYQKSPPPKPHLIAIHILLHDHYALHIRAARVPPKHLQPE